MNRTCHRYLYWFLASTIYLFSLCAFLKKHSQSDNPEIVIQNGHSVEVNAVCFSPDSKLQASGSNDNTIRLWEVATGRLLRTLEGHSSSVNRICLSPDDNQLASGSDNHKIKLWEVASCRLLLTIEDPFLLFVRFVFLRMATFLPQPVGIPRFKFGI